jgi:hypothetical protein
MGRKVQILVSLEIEDDANEQEVVAECDYSFTHEDIINTEILEVYEDA